jgi:hypothetical protein
MADENQNNIFPGGFLIKDKSGQLKKVQDDKIVDYKPAGAAVTSSQSGVAPQPQPTPSPVRPQPRPAAPLQPTVREIPALAPQPPVSSSPHAAFYFSPEDEEEIKKHAEALKGIMAKPKDVAASTDLAAVGAAVRSVTQKNSVNFNDEVLNKRFGKVMESFFNDVRTGLETEEVLARPQKIGGLALAQEVAKKIVDSAMVEAEKLRAAKIPSALPETLGLKPKTAVPEAKEDLSKALPDFVPRPQARPVAPPPSAPPVIIQPVKPTVEVSQRVEPKIAAPIPQPPLAEKFEESVPPSAPPQVFEKPRDTISSIAYKRTAEPSRPQMVDIKQPIKVVGPVEEMAEIDLGEFRKFSPNPHESAKRVLEKIQILQEDSWQMRLDGIKAWKRSETFQLYLALGRESLDNGIGLDNVIRARKQDGKPYLEREEFLAINDLNNNLTA